MSLYRWLCFGSLFSSLVLPAFLLVSYIVFFFQFQNCACIELMYVGEKPQVIKIKPQIVLNTLHTQLNHFAHWITAYCSMERHKWKISAFGWSVNVCLCIGLRVAALCVSLFFSVTMRETNPFLIIILFDSAKFNIWAKNRFPPSW